MIGSIGLDMANWQDTAQNCVIASIFAFMVAKLVSFVISFRRNRLRIEREASKEDWLAVEGLAEDDGDGSSGPSSESESEDDEKVLDNDVSEGCGEKAGTKTDVPTSKASIKGPDRATDADVGLRPLVDHSSGLSSSSSHVREKGEGKGEGEGDAREARHPDESVREGQDGSEEEVNANAISKARGELSDSDDWEGVESSELEERFGAAAAFVATQATWRGLKVSNEIQLLLYGLYKLATEGPCCIPQPPAYRITARSKWFPGVYAEGRVLILPKLISRGTNHPYTSNLKVLQSSIVLRWGRPSFLFAKNADGPLKLGNIESEEAMHRYIAVVSEVEPVWAQALDGASQRRSQGSVEGQATKSGGMGPVFSSLISSEDGGDEAGSMERIHICAREGDEAGLREQLDSGTAIDLADSDGHTALHWAADRGHLPVIELLLGKGAQINAKDSDGQTALHYAVTCDREEIAKVLVKAGADRSLEDNDGVCPLSSRPKHWIWMASSE